MQDVKTTKTKKRSVLLVLIFFLVLLIFANTGSVDSESKVNLDYHIQVWPDDLSCEGKIVLDGLEHDWVDLRMIRADAKRYRSDVDVVKNISDVSAQGKDGKELEVTEIESGWRVYTSDSKEITFQYSFGADMVGYSKVIDNEAFFLNEAILPFPDVSVEGITVAFDIPDEWSINTHFIPLGDNVFQVEGKPDMLTDLMQGTVMGILDYEVKKQCDDIELMFQVFRSEDHRHGLIEFYRLYYDTTNPKEEMLWKLELACEIINYYKDLFGFWPGGSRYVFYTPVAGDSGGQSYTGYTHRHPVDTRERKATNEIHHIAHAWCWAYPIGLNAPEGNMTTEGIPVYSEAEVTAKLTGDDMWLGAHYIRHLSLKRAWQFGLMEKDTIKTYSQGPIRILTLDKEIREATDGARSISDLLSLIGDRFGKHWERMSREDLIQAINEVAGADLTGFYHTYLAGEIASERPPSDDFIDDYEQEFMKWLDTYAEIPGYSTAGSRTMVLIALEMSIHYEDLHRSEHSIGGRNNPGWLYDFREHLREHLEDANSPLSEEGVVDILSNITGVDQSDFFDFYTVGEFRPCPDEVEEWMASIQRQYPSYVEDRSIAYLSPSNIPVGEKTEVKLVVSDPRLVSDDNNLRIGVGAACDNLFGNMLQGVQDHHAFFDKWRYENEGWKEYRERGVLPLKKTEEGWEGTMALTLPPELLEISILADDESEFHHLEGSLGIWLETDPDPGKDAYLSDLKVEPGTLKPLFDPDTTAYTVDLDHDVEAIDITATLSDENASLTINGEAATSGEAKIVNLNAAGTETAINVVVTAEDGETEKTYTITVNRAEEPAPPTEDVTRLSGANRYKTAVEISKNGWSSADTVILARYDDYADALAGVPLAYQLDAPILLTPTGSLHETTEAEIERLGAGEVILLGGENAISGKVKSVLESKGLSVDRIHGASRFETAVAIAKRLEKEVGATFDTAFIADGQNFPDALAASSYAAIRGEPILLTNTDSLPGATEVAIKDLGINKTYICGGPAAVSNAVEQQLANSTRLFGDTRYETGLALAEEFLPGGTIHVSIATGLNYPDAVAGGVWAAKHNTGILLVNGSASKPGHIVEEFLEDRGITAVTLFGGTVAVSSEMADWFEDNLSD